MHVSVALLKNPLSTATFNFKISDNYNFLKYIFPKVVMGPTRSTSEPHAACGPYLVQTCPVQYSTVLVIMAVT
jgi:hypothetical protein